MYWLILVIAGLLETVWAVGLKYSNGFTRPWVSFFTVLAMIVSMGMLGIAMKHLPLGTAYTIWVGIGSMGAVILGIFLMNDPVNPLRVLSLVLIMAGIIGLKLA